MDTNQSIHSSDEGSAMPAEIVSLLVALTERTNQIIFVFDTVNEQFLYLNTPFELVWHLTRESAFANPQTLLHTIHEDDKAYLIHSYNGLLKGRPMEALEFRFIRTDATERTACVSAYVVTGKEEKTVVAGFVEDITESKTYNETLKKFAAKKNSVLEILSHDLAGFFGTIQSLSGLLAKRVQKQEDVRLSQLIRDSSMHGMQLIREFVKQEFLESASINIIKIRVDVVAKVREVIEQYQLSQQLIAKTFQLISSSEKLYIAIDEVKLMQVVNNLLSNAIKFTKDDGVIITRIENKKKHVVISIEDNGIGIPEHLHEGLFEKFTKARRPGIKGEPSVGLGMSIIKTIVEWHNGRIWFESQENKGSVFYIELPKE